MSASYYLTAVFDNYVIRRELDGCSVTRPFLFAKGVACETRFMHSPTLRSSILVSDTLQLRVIALLLFSRMSFFGRGSGVRIH